MGVALAVVTVNCKFPFMQTVFANLAMSNREIYMPKCFWKAFKDYDGEELNIREHQDGYEFFTRLQVTKLFLFSVLKSAQIVFILPIYHWHAAGDLLEIQADVMSQIVEKYA